MGKIWTGIVMGVMMSMCLLTPAKAENLPDPLRDEPAAQTTETRKIVLAGGCFWGIEAIFLHVKGVQNAASGYTGGSKETATYDQVSTGKTGHAEAVEVTYDASQISLGQILKIFFSVAHDPTQLDAQGPDHGTQYRSAIFYENTQQQEIARDYIAQLDATGIFGDPIVTKLEPLTHFYPAESYHQNYVAFHPESFYVMIHDAPKLTALESAFPNLYVK